MVERLEISIELMNSIGYSVVHLWYRTLPFNHILTCSASTMIDLLTVQDSRHPIFLRTTLRLTSVGMDRVAA